jgi:hypothetical protein
VTVAATCDRSATFERGPGAKLRPFGLGGGASQILWKSKGMASQQILWSVKQPYLRYIANYKSRFGSKGETTMITDTIKAALLEELRFAKRQQWTVFAAVVAFIAGELSPNLGDRRDQAAAV